MFMFLLDVLPRLMNLMMGDLEWIGWNLIMLNTRPRPSALAAYCYDLIRSIYSFSSDTCVILTIIIYSICMLLLLYHDELIYEYYLLNYTSRNIRFSCDGATPTSKGSGVVRRQNWFTNL